MALLEVFVAGVLIGGALAYLYAKKVIAAAQKAASKL